MKSICLFALTGMLFFACNENEYAETQDINQFKAEAPASKQELTSNLADENKTKSKDNFQRKLIKNGALIFETDAPAKAEQLLLGIINQHQGFLAKDDESKTLWRYQRNLTVRLPKENFDAFVNDVTQKLGPLDSKKINVNDVTESYFDLTARIKAKKTLEARYLDLIAKAKNVQEVLNVERELGDVQSELEVMQGRLNLMNNQVALSTLNINYYQDFEVADIKPKDNKILKALQNGWDLLLGFFLFALNTWPIILLAIIGVYFVKRMRKKKA